MVKGRMKPGIVRRLNNQPSISTGPNGLLFKYYNITLPPPGDDGDFRESLTSILARDWWYLFDSAASQGCSFGSFLLDTSKWKTIEYSDSRLWTESPSHVREIFCLCLWHARQWVALALEPMPSSSKDRVIYQRVGLLEDVKVPNDDVMECVD